MANAQSTVSTAQPATALDPVVVVLATALKLSSPDAALGRAVDKALGYLAGTPVYSFDGTELRVTSQSTGREGTIYVCDAEHCTCEGGRHAWCYHRALFRLELAQAALTAPTTLLATIAEQTDPNPVGADDDTDAADDDWEAYHRQGAEQYRVDAIRQGTWTEQEGPVISLVTTPAPAAPQRRMSDAEYARVLALVDEL